MSEDCAFCRIIRRQLPGYIISEDEHVIAFLSKSNHPLIVPKQHIPNIYTLDEMAGTHIMKAAVQISRAVKAALHCEGIYLTQANEAAAGQDVFHFHLHIYPRWKSLDFQVQQQNEQVPEQDRQDTLNHIKAYLEKAD